MSVFTLRTALRKKSDFAVIFRAARVASCLNAPEIGDFQPISRYISETVHDRT